MSLMTIKAATDVAGPLGYPSKMPGTSYGISAQACITGAKLAEVEGSTCHGCYALKGNYIYPSVQMAHDKRIAGIANPLWTMAMVTLITTAHSKPRDVEHKNRRWVLPNGVGYHRWHDSGDLQSVEHLTKICAVAAMTPKIRHWLPTRELGIVSKYKAAGGIVPDNMVIRVSATMVDGPATKAWPNTSGVHTKAYYFSPLSDNTPPAKRTEYCRAPLQGNRCDDCRLCWNGNVDHVSYHKH